MALLSERKELEDAWRALQSTQIAKGWRTISICTGGPCRFLAGRHFPGAEEALLMEFDAALVEQIRTWPEGKGFSIARLPNTSGAKTAWVALLRKEGGSLDLFLAMAADTIETLKKCLTFHSSGLLRIFLNRIRSWQAFMDRAGDGLSLDDEVGLWGEIQVLKLLIEQGVSPLSACNAWLGPQQGLHDFQWEAGAIEVKTTIGHSSIHIGSLEQLDESMVPQLFLMVIQLFQAPSGCTLSEQVADLSVLLQNTPEALFIFEHSLLCVGYLHAHAERYRRRFISVSTRLWMVDGCFPRLTRAAVPSPIINTTYEVDPGWLPEASIRLSEAIVKIGAI